MSSFITEEFSLFLVTQSHEDGTITAVSERLWMFNPYPQGGAFEQQSAPLLSDVAASRSNVAVMTQVSVKR